MRALNLWNVPLVCVATLVSCAGDPMAPVRQDYASGRYREARARLTRLVDEHESDAHLYHLERGVASLAVGEPREAVRDLRIARDRLDDENRGTDYAGFIKAMLLDDRQLTYQGYDYEQVMVRALLAVADLADGNSRDATAYALQVAEKQEEIIESFEARDGSRPKDGYKLVAFGSYLHGIISEEQLRFDVARQSFERVREIEPEAVFVEEDLRRVTEGHHSERGNGVIWILALVGRGPHRIEADEPVTRAAFASAQLIWAILRRRATLPNITSVKIPALAFHVDNPTEVHVEVDGSSAGWTGTITDVERTALAEFEAMRPHIIARAVVRRAIKVIATEGVKEVVNPRRRRDYRAEHLLLDLAISAAGLLWTAVEEADLRCWSLVPARLQALRIEVPAGEHDVFLRAGVRGQPIGGLQRSRVLVRDGFNTYVIVLAPTSRGGPPPMSSEAVEAEIETPEAPAAPPET